jgi:hypothetical protein
MQGNTVVNGGNPQTGGLLTQNSNIGTFKENRDVFVPELDINLHLHLTQNIDFSFGYSFVYFTTVALAGDQVDRRVNLTQFGGPLVGAALPGVLLRDTDFWYQGLNLGLNGRF